MARGRGRVDFQDAGILTYFEDLKIEPDKEIGADNNFEMGSIQEGAYGLTSAGSILQAYADPEFFQDWP
jgi:hypothetical protein